MSARNLAALAAASLLAACSGLPPASTPRAPATDIASSFADTQALPDAPQASALPWRDFFGDTNLQRLIDVALKNNRDLRLSALAIEQARAQMQLREADLWPTINLAATGSRTPNGAGAFNTLYLGGLQMTAYEVDLFGRLRSLGDASAAQFKASEAQRNAAQISLIASVAQAWLNLQADEALLEVTRRTLASREETLRITESRHRLGAAPLSDVRAAQSLLEGTRASLVQQQRQRAQDGHAMSLLLGVPFASLDVGVPPLQGLTAFAEIAPGLPSEVLRRRPDVQAAELQLLAAQANIDAARANFFPRITLTASAGSASRALTNLFNGGTFALGLAPALVQPLFDAGRNQANLQSAQVAREQAVTQYERAIQQAFREVADALVARSTLLEQLQSLEAQVSAEAARAALVDVRHRSGAASFLDVLDAQRSLQATQQALVLAQSQAAQSMVGLYKALGGGVK